MNRRKLLSTAFGWFGLNSVARLLSGRQSEESPTPSEYIHQIRIGRTGAGGPITLKPFGRGDSPHEFVADTTGTGKTARLERIITTVAESEREFEFYDPKGEER